MISQRYLDLCDETAQEAYDTPPTVEFSFPALKKQWEHTQSWMMSEANVVVQYDVLYSSLFLLAKYGIIQLALMRDCSTMRIRDILKETHVEKNAGYSGTDPDPWRNFREVEKFGISAVTGCLTRLCDKYSRFQNVYKNPELDKVNESALDTMIDFVAYCIILICLLEETP